ncbi:MAG TPA: outer membrane beta-barrel protein [Gemmatimonadales bacterium]|nr:outer membrane beta-barrel protein [Gemmatimonadales bacterium]
MPKTTLGLALLVGALAIAPPARAQEASPGPRIALAPYAGYLTFDAFVDGPLGTSLGNGGAALFGAQLAVPLTRHLSLYGHVGHAAPSLQVGVPFLGGVGLGRTSVWLYDGGVQLSLAALGLESGRVRPFAQAGVGRMRTTLEVASIRAHANSTVLNLGVGADLALGRNVALQLMARDFAGKMRFGVGEIGGLGPSDEFSHNFAFSAGVKVGF